MDAAFATIDRGIADLAAVDLAVLTAEEIGRGILAMQTAMDRTRVIQARWMSEGDQRGLFTASGHRDGPSWLAAKGKTTKGAADKQARLGKTLNDHPAVADAVAKGDLSPDAVDALTPTLDGDHSGDVAELVEHCKGATPAQARAAGSAFREAHPPAGSTPKDREDELRKKRSLRFTPNGDGTTNISGTLTDLDARTVQEALRSIIGKPTIGDVRTFEQKLADALVQLCAAYNAGQVKGGRSNLPTILVVIDVNDLNGNTNGPGYTSRGDVIPAEAVRKMTSNANLQRVILDDSVPLDLGRMSRLATWDQWRALVARDGGCRFDGCQIPAEWCQVVHIHEWDAQTGPTNIDLLVLWCVYHHHYRHQPGIELIGDGNNLTIQLPDGRIVPLPARGPTHASKHRKATNTSGTNADGGADQNRDNGQSDSDNLQGNLFGDTAA